MVEILSHVVPTVIVLGLLIFVHELGHFLACRWAGVGVEKFSIGFGPELIGWKLGETYYAIAAIPFGGFVKPSGETYEEIDQRGGALGPLDFLAASHWKRFVILVAGVAMNFLFAYVLFVAVMLVGRPVPAAEIGGFIEGLPAEASGLRVGDKITRVDHVPVRSWQELTMRILESEGPSLHLTVEREGEVLDFRVKTLWEEGRDMFGQRRSIPRIGITRAERYDLERYPLGLALVRAAQLEWHLTALTCEALWRLATGKLSPKALIGPIGIMSIAGTAVKTGIASLLQFTALLSVSLGVVNLLPIPALDGGHLFFLGIEAIRKKPINYRLQERVTQFGFCFLMLLMVWVVFNDLVNMGAFEKIHSLFS